LQAIHVMLKVRNNLKKLRDGAVGNPAPYPAGPARI
jgi:hypothetical protein